MALSRPVVSRFLVVLLALALPMAVFAQPVGKPSGGGSAILWNLNISGHEKVRVSVLGPDETLWVKEFSNGKTPTFSITDMGGSAADGQYNYELRVEPKVSSDVKKKLEKARAAGDDEGIKKIKKEAGLGAEVVQSGTFTVMNGFIVDPNGIEADANDSVSTVSRGAGTTSNASSTNSRNWGVAANDQVIPDDLIVQSSTCTGFDCVDGESFGFDTLRLKENNLRIHFDDTSSSAGYPANDWRIIANDSASGGANMLAFEDSTAARNPMLIEAGSPANSIYIDSTGNIGFQQSAPGLDLHLTTTDTPAMRLEQTNAGGFTAQTWDIGANEANFFVRDLTGGSKLSFRIRPGAPTSSIDIAADGDVGISTASPQKRLHVVDTAGTTIAGTQMSVQGPTGGFGAGIEFASNLTGTSTYASMGKIVADADNSWNTTVSTQDARVGIFVPTDGVMTERLRVSSSGTVTVTGNLTVTGTKNFAMPDPGDKSKALYYVALEGPEAGTYFRGSAKTVNGEVTIELPGYFSRITESERMTVQLTSVGKYGQLFVSEKSPSKLVIKVAEGTEDLEFDYLVQGVRKGYLNYEVERENKLGIE
jgi:hypothetical protein